jgi:hypothetical protein
MQMPAQRRFDGRVDGMRWGRNIFQIPACRARPAAPGVFFGPGVFADQAKRCKIAARRTGAAQAAGAFGEALGDIFDVDLGL